MLVAVPLGGSAVLDRRLPVLDPVQLASAMQAMRLQTHPPRGKTLDEDEPSLVQQITQNFHTLAELHPSHSIYKKAD